MKILLLNPQIDAEHNISKSLQEQGVAILFPLDATEAWQMLRLHGDSIDLGIIHKEGIGAIPSKVGLDLVARLKADPRYADLPLILTTQEWSNADCIQHQESPQGVNAYLHSPFTEDQLVEMIEGVLGQYIGKSSRKQAQGQSEDSGLILQDATAIFTGDPQSKTSESGSILLEAPDPHEQPISIPTATLILDRSSDLSDSVVDSDMPRVPNETSVSVDKSSELELFESLDLAPPPSVAEKQDSDGTLVLSIPLEFNENGSESKNENEKRNLENLGSPLLESSVQSSSGFDLEASLASLKRVDSEASASPDLAAEDISENSGDGSDHETKQEMPYLFDGPQTDLARGSQERKRTTLDRSYVFGESLGNAIVPGGAAQVPDVETLKKYLLLREQDVAILSSQLSATQDQIRFLDQNLREEKAKNAELTHVAQEQKRKIDDFERVKISLQESLQTEMNELKFQVKAKTDKARVLELQTRELAENMDHLKERVRTDIRKIRVREKELENRLEIMKKDSEALISARENKIIELKRKLDLLEFNMDLLQDQYAREKQNSEQLRQHLGKVAKVVKVADGLLDANKSATLDQENETEAETEAAS